MLQSNFIKDDDGWRYRLSSRKDVAAAAVALEDELPVVISLLNAFTGLAAAATGFELATTS